jgi:hypothetical protein
MHRVAQVGPPGRRRAGDVLAAADQTSDSTCRWVPRSTGTTVVADLLTRMSCDAAALADVRRILGTSMALPRT